MPLFGGKTTKVFDKAEFMFPIKCDVHPWMRAYAGVLSHPYFDVSKADGSFKIRSDQPTRG